MLRVDLARNWFGPDGVRYHKRNNPVEIPEEYEKLLPKGAKVLGTVKEETAPAPEKKK